MKNLFFYISSVSLVVVLNGSILLPQSARSNVNKGVDLYNKKKYIDSEVEFKKGAQKDPDNFNSVFNLGDSYYKEGKYDEAIKSYSSALSKTKSGELKSKAFHNIGNALLKGEKYKESVGAYANALKLNPNDEQTKYNLSYALNMMKNKDNQDKNNKNNKNNKDQNKQNKDKNKDQNKQNQNKDQNKDQNKNNQDQQKNQQNQNNNDQKNQPKPQPDKISKDQAQAIFNALNNDEKNMQKQLRKMKGNPNKTGKDW